MPKIEHQTITNFAPGMNTLDDERVLLPNAQGEPAESPYMENVEITSKGAVVTSTGFELVSTGTGTAGCKNLITYEKDPSTRYLVVTTDDDHGYITPSSATWTAIGDYGLAADYVGSVIYKGSSGVKRVILGTSLNVTLVDAKINGTVFAFGNAAATEKVGQTFTAASDVPATAPLKVTFKLYKNGAPTDNLVAKLYASDKTTLLATSASFSGYSVAATETEVTFELISALTAGTTYFVELARSAAVDPANYYFWTESIGGYAGGSVWHYITGTWTEVAANDAYMSITYSNPVKKWDGAAMGSIYGALGTCTMTIAAPAVVTYNNHGLAADTPVHFTTTGTFPLVVGKIYYVSRTGIATNSFQLAETVGGASINTTGTQSGVHTLYTLNGTPKGWIMESWMGKLFIADGKTLYYSYVDTEDAWEGTIGFDDNITGLKAQGDFLFVHMRRETQPIQMYYNDSFTLSSPLKKPYKYATGCMAHKTIDSVYNDFYLFTPDGVQRFGSDPQFIASNTRVNSLSWKIDPSLIPENYNPSKSGLACAKYFDKKYFLSIPYNSDEFNSKTFVYDWRYDSWAMRSGFYPAGYAVMADTNNRDELYFASALQPKIFKFNNTYTYAGDGYERKYMTKVFVFGGSMVNKFYHYLDIRGSMYINTIFYVDITVDGTTKTYQIDSGALETSSTGGYYGDDYWGSSLYGGPSESPFKRFGVRLPFPVEVKDGRELQITIRNNRAGQPWKVDYMDIAYSFDALEKVPYIFQSATLIS